MARKYDEVAETQSLEKELTEIKDLYELVNPLDIARFLKSRSFLKEVLVEAHGKILEFFPGAQMKLERYLDSIDDNGDCLMDLTVSVPAEMEEVGKTIRKFDTQWYFEAIRRVLKNNVCISWEHPSLKHNWDWLRNMIGTVEMPEDWSLETDHYRLGTPKRYS
jgi:hypothetical protein